MFSAVDIRLGGGRCLFVLKELKFWSKADLGPTFIFLVDCAGQQLTYFVSCYIFAKVLLPWGNGSQTLVCLHLKGSKVAFREHSGYAGPNSSFYRCIYSMRSSLTLSFCLSHYTQLPAKALLSP